MFLLLEFFEETPPTVAIVPGKWFKDEEGLCFWPPTKDLLTWVKKQKEPEVSWKLCKARLLHRFGT